MPTIFWNFKTRRGLMMRWKKIKRNSSKHAMLAALFVTLIGGAFLIQRFGNEYFSSLASNLVAEFIGAAATVYGIDYLIKRREEIRLLPVKAASYEDVRIMTHWALDLWREAYAQSVADSTPNSWNELFSTDSLNKIIFSLDVSKPANTLPRQTWASYFDGMMAKIHSHSEKVLERHGGLLDPQIYSAVHAIAYHNHHKITSLIAVDKETRIPRPTHLGGYMPIINAWFDSILVMHAWTIQTYPYMIRNDMSHIHAPYEFPKFEATRTLPARIDDEVFSAQIQAFQQWQQQRTAQSGGG